MKRGVTLIVLGVLGIIQYAYFQLSPLAMNYSYEVSPDPTFGQFGLMHLESTVTRDWTVGIVGLVVGLVLFLLGILQLSKRHKAKKMIVRG